MIPDRRNTPLDAVGWTLPDVVCELVGPGTVKLSLLPVSARTGSRSMSGVNKTEEPHWPATARSVLFVGRSYGRH
jgi:hypothetical protein